MTERNCETNISNRNSSVTRTEIQEYRRLAHVGNLFGIHFPLRLEPFIYTITETIASDYHGGYWDFYSLSNGGFYMAPKADEPYRVACENGFSGKLSADALGITACMYAYSHLSFGNGKFAAQCAEQYHWLREYMLEHPEAGGILGAID